MKTLAQAACRVALFASVAALAGCGSSAILATPTPTPTPTPSPTPAPVVPEVNNCKSTDTTSPPLAAPAANYPGTALAGVVKAGQQPLIGASVQMYAAGTSGNGSAGTALLGTPVLTGASGGFSIPAYTCPESNSVLYVVATGGSTTASGTANGGTKLASAIGACNAISGSPSFTVDEATTVATAFAMSQFMTAGGNIGATATNVSGISLAAASAANLVNLGTGIGPGAAFPATGTAPTAKLNTVANLLNGCIVSGASTSACTQLYAATARAGVTPTNTLDAVVNLAKQPGTNVASLYNLSSGSVNSGSPSSGSTAYAPALGKQPADWMLYVTYSGGGMNAPSALSIDSTGTVWAANYFNVASAFTNTGTPVSATGFGDSNLYNSYGGAVSVRDDFLVANEQSSYAYDGGLGSVTALNKGGSLGTFGGGGLDFPIAVAFDTSGNEWVVDYGDSSVSLFNSSNAPVSTNSYTSSALVFPVAIATDADCNAYIANEGDDTITRVSADGSSLVPFVTGNGPDGIAVDASGNVWSANYYGSSVGLLTAAGAIPAGSTGYTGGGLSYPDGIAADGAGNIWVANYRAPGLSELAGASATSPGAALSPSAGWAPDAGLLLAYALAIDASGNIWISNFDSNTLTEFVGIAAPVRTPLIGPVRVP